MNSRAQIGTTITWFAAIVLIIAIFIFYISASFWLSKGTLESNTIGESNQIVSYDFSQTENLISFLELNGGIVSKWADADDEWSYLEVCKLFTEGNFDKSNLDEGYIYFDVNNPNTLLIVDNGKYRNLVVEKLGEKVSCVPARREFGNYKFKIASNIIFISDEKNLVEVKYVRK